MLWSVVTEENRDPLPPPVMSNPGHRRRKSPELEGCSDVSSASGEYEFWYQRGCGAWSSMVTALVARGV